MTQPLLKVASVTKRFGGVQALQQSRKPGARHNNRLFNRKLVRGYISQYTFQRRLWKNTAERLPHEIWITRFMVRMRCSVCSPMLRLDLMAQTQCLFP